MPTRDRTLRLGLIGCGYVSKYHLAASAALNVPIVAVCDRKHAAAEAIASKIGARTFDDAEALIASGGVDAIILATPHFQHVPLAIAALERGLHVLCEKPLAVTAAEADLAIAAQARHPDLTFAVNFNHRAWPLWRSIKSLLDRGELGPIVRWQWTITDWYRSQWYFEQSAWRGTWNGEGGGLLVNQCPHQLDLVTHLFGLPTRVLANVRRGKHHRIRVEDEVHALVDHASGATGCFIASTGEPCGTNRLEIVGDRGVIRVTAEDSYELITYATPASVHTATSQHRNAPPAFTTQTIAVGDRENEYRDVLANFVEACVVQQKPLASVEQARGSIELANAILLSGETGRSVTLPADRGAVAELLARLQREEQDRSGGPR